MQTAKRLLFSPWGAGVALGIAFAAIGRGDLLAIVFSVYLAVALVVSGGVIGLVGVVAGRSFGSTAQTALVVGLTQAAVAVPLLPLTGALAISHAQSWCERNAVPIANVTCPDGCSLGDNHEVRASAPHLVWLEPNGDRVRCAVSDPRSMLRYHVYDPVGERWYEAD